MKKAFHFLSIPILQQKFTLITSIVALSTLIIGLGLILFKLSALSSPLIIHFDSFNGIDLFGEKTDVWGIWITGLVMFITNTVIANEFFYRLRPISYFLISANVILTILILVVISTIITIN
ncbi:hypothetical protein HY967_00500 [Candidatus Jorgensenbacteria bacterium]|nr:hypothetical protein [Candidatus Jorgensenbacteria bacterium]